VSDELNEIWALYADDGNQALDSVEEALLVLKQNPTDAEAIAGLFRGMHTFKGNSRLLGLSIIESRAHIAEDLIGLVRDEGAPLDSEIIGLLFEAADIFRGMMEKTLETRRDADATATADFARRMKDKFERVKAGPSAPEAAQPQFPECEDEPLEAILFEPAPERCLADDPLYREIFLSMIGEIIAELRESVEQYGSAPDLARAAAADAYGRLLSAARQIRMPEWPELLESLADRSAASASEAGQALEELIAAHNRATSTAPTEEEIEANDPNYPEEKAIVVFFMTVEPMLRQLAAFDARLSAGEQVGADELISLSAEIQRAAELASFVRVADVVTGFPEASGSLAAFRALLFSLFTELAHIEEAAQLDSPTLQPSATIILQSWCAERVFQIFTELHEALDNLRKRVNVDKDCSKINVLLRQLYFACKHYQIDSAGHLSMSLVDLFERVLAGEMTLDPVLLQVLKSFLATMELVFDAANAGEAPDMAAIETLLEQASSVPYTTSHTGSSNSIEVRLGLPKPFHNILTPESVRTASAALETGQTFYIIRADINRHEDVANNFLGWISSDTATTISNVTVFSEDSTLFDFLIASPLSEPSVVEILTRLDPLGEALSIQKVLTDRRAGASGDDNSASKAAEQNAISLGMGGGSAQDTLSINMLESIGEIVTSHAMVHHMLAQFAEEDLVRSVEAEVRNARGDWNAARDPVRQYLQSWNERVEKLVQVESQLAGRLDSLQEQAIAIRARSAALLLKPLASFADGIARRCSRQVELSTMGDDASLDFTTLENLKGPLRSLISFCVSQSIETPEARVAFGKEARGHIRVRLNRHDDHVSITIEDDGAGFDLNRITERARRLGWSDQAPSPSFVLREGYGLTANSDEGENGLNFAEVHQTLRLGGGDLRIANLPTGGLTMHVTMPLAMVVLDGMVVRVGEVMYVVPIDAIQRIVHSRESELMRVSADEGRYMLQLGHNDVLPVQFLVRKGRDSQNNGYAENLRAPVSQAAKTAAPEEQKHLFVVAGKESRRVALSIDELIGQQMVLIRPLQGYLSAIRGVTGCALLGSGGVGMVLDMGFVLSQA
jgi:two-component system, chemotaxis family, sensor kinase CheA